MPAVIFKCSHCDCRQKLTLRKKQRCLVCLQVPLALVVAFLAARQAYCIAGNLTTNELLNLHRYQYLKRDDGTMYNRFDRGPVANCIQFWRCTADNWDDMFHEERLVGVKTFLCTKYASQCLIQQPNKCMVFHLPVVPASKILVVYNC